MSLNFNKVEEGSTLNFSKDLGLDFSKATNIMINLNWGVPAGRRSVDLDSSLSVITGAGSTSVKKAGFIGKLFGAKDETTTTGSKSVKSFVHCFALGCGKSDGIKHHGDDTTGAWSDGEFIEIDATKLGADVTELVPGVLSYSGDDMGNLPFAHIKVYLGTKDRVDTPLFEADLTDISSGTMHAVFGKLVKVDGDWTWQSTQKLSKTRSFDALKKTSKEI